MRVLLAGATGYIGQAVLRELVAQGHEVVALVRPGRKLSLALSDQEPSEVTDAVAVVEAEITSDEDWAAPLTNADVVVSCLASRSGAPADARLVEYEANRRLLAYAERAGVQHFVLLSAICVQIPRLAFQREKLKFEALLAESSVPATIIRATNTSPPRFTITLVKATVTAENRQRAMGMRLADMAAAYARICAAGKG